MCLSVPQPRFVLIGAAFELGKLCMAWIVAYVGSLSIGDIVGGLKLSTILSTEVAAMVVGGAGN